MKKVLIIISMFLVLCGCEATVSDIDDGVLNTTQALELMKENEYVIVDVRTKAEYEEGHLVDAINIPYDEIDENVELDKEKVIFVYCKSGNRSGIAYKNLKDLGYEVYDLGAYSEINLPKE